MCDNCVPLRITFLASISLVLPSQSFFYLKPLFADWGQFAKTKTCKFSMLQGDLFHHPLVFVSFPFTPGATKHFDIAFWFAIWVLKHLNFLLFFLPPTCHIFSLRQCCHSFPEGLFNLHCCLEGSVKPLLVYVNFLFGKGKLIYFCNF